MSTKRLTKDLINRFSIINGANHFSSGIFQNYLVFIPRKKYINYFYGTTWIDSWKTKGISYENIENTTKSSSNLSPTFVDYHLLLDIDFNGYHLIKQSIFIPKKITNPYISYTINPRLRNLSTDFTLANCLF